MLSKNHKTIINTLTYAVLAVTTLGGIANAELKVVNEPVTGFDAHEYQFPPSNALQQNLTRPAPAVRQVTKPVLNTQARRPYTQARPMPYPAPGQAAPYGAPRTPAYSAPRPPAYGAQPYGAPRTPNYGAQPYGAPRTPNYGAQPYGAPRTPNYGAQPYGTPRTPAYDTQPGGPGSQPIPAPFPTPAWAVPGAGPYGPYNNRPVYGNSNSSPYGNPYNRGPSNNRGPFGGGSPFKNFGGGPFNSNSAPWETWPFGARDSFWSRKEFPFKEQSPSDWFNPGDPKEGMAVMWDDLIAAPDDLGTMPGGWNVPSISVPNPVDLEDQLEEASKEIPDLIRIYND